LLWRESIQARIFPAQGSGITQTTENLIDDIELRFLIVSLDNSPKPRIVNANMTSEFLDCGVKKIWP